MTGTARFNFPDPSPRVDNVRRLRRKLWVAAKQSEDRRFHAVFDRVCRGDVLWAACRRVRAKKGAAGVDRLTLEQVEGCGVQRMLDEFAGDLRGGSYRPAPAGRVDIPEPDGGRRPLGISTVRDRVAQAAVKLVVEPMFEADFVAASFGFGPQRSATQAMERVRTGFIAGNTHVAEFDIRDFFGCIDHRRLSDRRVLELVRLWLQAGVLVDGVVQRTVAGTRQGGVIPPLLADIYLHELDVELTARGVGTLVRYADDGVVLCRSAEQAQQALATVGDIRCALGLELHPGKTKVVDLRGGREGSDSLGYPKAA